MIRESYADRERKTEIERCMVVCEVGIQEIENI